MWAIWITGLPGSGKSTIAKELRRKLKSGEILRLDEIRRVITPKAKYTKEERAMVYRSLAYIGFILTRYVNVIFDATDNLGIGRKTARRLIKDFIVVQLRCPINVCMERERSRKDRAGMRDLYARARAGEIELPGVSAEYVEEKNPEILIDTDKITVEDSVDRILNKIKELEWIS
jgi:adenylylsulfate kinase